MAMEDNFRRELKAEADMARKKTAQTEQPLEEAAPDASPEPALDSDSKTLQISVSQELDFKADDYDLIILPYGKTKIPVEFERHEMFADGRLMPEVLAATSKFEAPYGYVGAGNILLIKSATASKFYGEELGFVVQQLASAPSEQPFRILDCTDYTQPGAWPLGQHLRRAAQTLARFSGRFELTLIVTASSMARIDDYVAELRAAPLYPFDFAALSIQMPEGGTDQTFDTPPEPKKIDDTRTHFLADHATDEDLLGYHPYAMGIASFVKDRDTALPLTIAIDGAWGKGKSSLMKMLRNELDPNRPTTDTIQPRKSWLEGAGVPFRLVWIWLRSFFALKADIPADTDERRFATVFINAWRHGKGSQLKARIVDEILTTMTARFGPAFLLRLQMKRLDRMGLLETATKALFTSSLVLLPILFLSILLLGALWISPEASVLPESWVSFFAQQKGASSLGVVLTNVFLFAWKRKPSLKLDDYLRAPDYTKLAGDDAEIEDDFRRILEALEERGCSLALFIDDLDRCSPKECADVVEVLNTFFGSEGRECLFILGMHREMVASALDVAYKDLVEKIEANDLLFEQRPFGRRFLEKIVQFVVALPEPDDNATEDFLNALTAGRRRGHLEEIKALEKAQAREKTDSAGTAQTTVDLLQKYVRPLMPGLSGAIFDATTDSILERLEAQGVNIEQAKAEARKMAELKDRIEARKNANENEYVVAFKEVREVIRANPRQYKRFFNKLRFYRLLNVAEDNPMFVDACEAVLALEHPELHYRTVKASGSFLDFALVTSKPGGRPTAIKELLDELDGKPGLKALREKLAKDAMAAA